MTLTWEEYLVQAPTDVQEWCTIEIFHPDFAAVLRFVQDFEDQTLTLESDAPRNPGEDVLFTAINIEIQEPSQNPSSGPVLTVNMGAVGNEVQDQIAQITDDGLLQPIEVIYRRYYEGQTTGPVRVFRLSASNLKFESYSGVAFTAQDVDFALRPAGEIYTLERFVGLAGV